jgi:hypothetical protein
VLCAILDSAIEQSKNILADAASKFAHDIGGHGFFVMG